MGENLLNKVINGQVNINSFIEWLESSTNTEDNYEDINTFNMTHTDFLTYFLNFIHESVFCNLKINDTPQKPIKKSEIIEENVPRNTSKGTTNPLPLSSSENLDNSRSDLSYVSRDSCLTSTPRLHQSVTSANSSRELSYFTPISPINSHNNYSTPERTRHSANYKYDANSSICLGDFIINKKSSTKKKNRSADNHEELGQKRRINPTSLTEKKANGHFRRSKNSFNFQSSMEEVPLANASDHRSFLVEEKRKILESSGCSNERLVKKITPVVVNDSNKSQEEPDIKKVLNVLLLDRFISIYISILNRNMVLNITSEIYFLISLLVNKHFVSLKENLNNSLGVAILNDSDEKCSTSVWCNELFNSIHNVVYFAVKCLESQLEVLKFYDKLTLKLLVENERLIKFAPDLVYKLKTVLFNKTEKPNKEYTEDTNNIQTSICFNVDTDNIKNFVDSLSFQAFRKQRDMFYEILRIWETSHLSRRWDFAGCLGGKIRTLFSCSTEPTNFMHFARLFTAQLLSSCKYNQKEESLSTEQLPFLSSLPNVDTEKLNLLKNRLVTKQHSNGINSVPDFLGHQEFYKQFIIVAANHVFNKHLSDCLISNIIELNDSKAFSTDLEEHESNADVITRKLYLSCIKSLRVLAKFLAFVEALPYKSECGNFSESVLAAHLNSRRQTVPSLNINQLLTRARHENTLVLIIPWLTVYLSVLDYVTLGLPYFIEVHKILFQIYKECLSKKQNNMTPYNAALIKFSLGWLFELPHFPESEYFKFCSSFEINRNSLNPQQNGVKTTESSMDKLDLVNQNILYVCCPFLDEIKKLLSSNASHKRITVKHITPVSTALHSKDDVKKKLEQQLEEAFLNGQPASLRKTIEFISERVALSIVKHICDTVVPDFKKLAVNEFRKFLETSRNDVGSDENQYKLLIKSESAKMAQKHFEHLHKQCEELTKQMSVEQTKKSVEGLLSIDMSSAVKDVTVTIATRYCCERVKQWTDSNIIQSIFTKEFDSEMQKVFSSIGEGKKSLKENKLVFVLPASGKNIRHNENALSGFHMLEKIRSSCCEVLESPSNITESSVISLLKNTVITLTERNDVNECISGSICTTILDYALLLVSHKPSLMTDDKILTDVLTVLKCYPGAKSDLFKDLLSDRNVMLLSQSSTRTKSWESFAKFVEFFIKSGFLSCEEFESQCTGFFQIEWDQDTLANFNIFLNTFLQVYKCNNNKGNVTRFTELLRFLKDFCRDL